MSNGWFKSKLLLLILIRILMILLNPHRTDRHNSIFNCTEHKSATNFSKKISKGSKNVSEFWDPFGFLVISLRREIAREWLTTRWKAGSQRYKMLYKLWKASWKNLHKNLKVWKFVWLIFIVFDKDCPFRPHFLRFREKRS